MQLTAKFKLGPVPGHDLKASLVNASGRHIGIVEGKLLVAQFEIEAGTLLVTTDGNPGDEFVHFTLLDTKPAMVDRVSLGQSNKPSVFRDLVVENDSTLRFRFFNDEQWSLHVRLLPRTHLKGRLGSPIRYPGSWIGRHYLELARP